MALAIPTSPHTSAFAYPKPCCLAQAHDAHRLASAVAGAARSGRVVDIGCGAGGVAIPLLRARGDVEVTGIEISPELASEARDRADVIGVGARIRVVEGDALTVPMPEAASIVANPPMLPTEPGFVVAGPDDLPPQLFMHALLGRIGSTATTDVWLHVFDFLGLDQPSDHHPSLSGMAASHGFEISYPHRGWRAVGPTSAIRSALPALGALFPEAVALVDGRERPFARLTSGSSQSLLIRHSIVRLNRPALPAGDPR